MNVSIPYRYGITNHTQQNYWQCLKMFQFLIGTVLLFCFAYTIAEEPKKQFQFLIGTVLHQISLRESKTNWKQVSIPYRYGITETILGTFNVWMSFNSL